MKNLDYTNELIFYKAMKENYFSKNYKGLIMEVSTKDLIFHSILEMEVVRIRYLIALKKEGKFISEEANFSPFPFLQLYNNLKLTQLRREEKIKIFDSKIKSIYI